MKVDNQEMRPEWLIPNGVFVVTLGLGDQINAYTAAWVNRISEVPVMLSVAVWDQNYSFELSQNTSHFAIHILEDGQQDVARHFGKSSGRGQNKLDGVSAHCGKSGLPILDDCLAHLECEVIFRRIFGDHMILFGRAIETSIHREGTALVHDYADYHDDPG